MNIKISEASKIMKNTFGKYVYPSEVHLYTLLQILLKFFI